MQHTVPRAHKLTIAAQQRQKHDHAAKHAPVVSVVNVQVFLPIAGLDLKITGPNRHTCIGLAAHR